MRSAKYTRKRIIYKDHKFKMKEALALRAANGVRWVPPESWNKARDDIINDNLNIDDWVKYALSPSAAEQFKAFTTLHHSLTKENTMSCESNKAPIRNIIDNLNFQITCHRNEAELAARPPMDHEKYLAELRKQYAAYISSAGCNIEDVDAIINGFACIEERVRNKYDKRPKFDTSKYDALNKELKMIATKAMIRGDEAVRDELMTIAEKIAKL